jgi:hypothetical protein
MSELQKFNVLVIQDKEIAFYTFLDSYIDLYPSDLKQVWFTNMDQEALIRMFPGVTVYPISEYHRINFIASFTNN